MNQTKMTKNNIERGILKLVNKKEKIERTYKVWPFEFKTWFNWVHTNKWLLMVEIWPNDRMPRLNKGTSLITYPEPKLVNEWTSWERTTEEPFEVKTKDLSLYLEWYTLVSTSEQNEE